MNIYTVFSDSWTKYDKATHPRESEIPILTIKFRKRKKEEKNV